MAVNRFSFLLGHFHLSDNTKEPKKGTPSYDKLYKLRFIINELNKNFKTFWNPCKHQSIDETMIKFKGRISIRQYMPAKPIKRGYKVWIRADETGFVSEFQIYTGKADGKVSYGLGERVVIDLTRELVGGCYHVYFDNFFTSTSLLLSLRKDNIFACGTVRQNRKNLPKKQMSDKDMERGESEYRTSITDLRWVKWKDNRTVQFLSNFHDPRCVGFVNRRQNDGTVKSINCPMMVHDYNKNMGYVDKADQLRSTYSINRKARKWWPRIFWFLIDTTVVNAFIIYKSKCIQKGISLKKFRLDLVRNLAIYNLKSKRGPKTHQAVISAAKPQIPLKQRQNVEHLPLRIARNRRCAHCSTKAKPKFAYWICKSCKVPLCLNSTTNCFVSYHA